MAKLRHRSGLVSALRKRHPGGHRVDRPKPVQLCGACDGDGYYVESRDNVTTARIICHICKGSGRLVE